MNFNGKPGNAYVDKTAAALTRHRMDALLRGSSHVAAHYRGEVVGRGHNSADFHEPFSYFSNGRSSLILSLASYNPAMMRPHHPDRRQFIAMFSCALAGPSSR